MKDTARILIVDDEHNTREAMARYLRLRFNVTTAADGGWTASNWAKEEVSQADAAGLLPDVLAKADLTQPITRLEYAHAIIALYTARTGEDPTLQDSRNIAFPDCNDPAVRAADRLGLIAGFPDGTFRPDDPLTREQAAVLLDRYDAAVAA